MTGPSSARLAPLFLLGLFGAAAGAIALWIAYACAPGLTLSMEVDTPVTRGLYPAERNEEGATFAWTRSQATIRLPGLDRTRPWRAELRYQGARTPPAELPDVRIAIDGRDAAQQKASNSFQDLLVDLPTDARRGARLTIDVSNTVFAGEHDPRQLGILVDEIRVRPVGGGLRWAPAPAVAGAAMAGAICGLLFGCVGLPSRDAAIGVGAVAVGQAMILAAGVAPYVAAISTAPTIAIGVALGTLAAAGIARVWAAAPLSRPARGVLALSGGLLFLELLLLLHPNLPIGDALFQAHRFEWVRGGRWLFTSTAPGAYEFPYAIALYLFALPFSSWVPTVSGSMGFVALLRILVAVVDTVAGALLYPMLARGAREAGAEAGERGASDRRAGDRWAGAAAVLLFHVIPLHFNVQTVGNLTNAFGQSLFVISLAALLLGLLRPGAYGRLALLALLMTVTLLAHTSTFAIAVVAFLLIAVAFRWRGGPDVRPLALPLAVATLVSVVISVAVYYGHFGETYAEMWHRIRGDMALPAEVSDPGGRSVSEQAALVPYYVGAYLGWPAVLLAAVGLVLLRHRQALSLVLLGWLGAALLFLVIGLLTPVDMRYYLAAFPAIALLGGAGAARAARRGPFAQAAAVVLLLAAVLLGAGEALGTLR